MAAIASLTLADGQATPVNKTFIPMDCTSALAVWTDRSSGIGLGMPKLDLSVSVKSGQSTKVRGTVAIPVMEVISGADGGYTPSPKVAYTMRGKIDFELPERSTLQNRKDLRAFVRNYLADAVIQKAVEDFERPY